MPLKCNVPTAASLSHAASVLEVRSRLGSQVRRFVSEDHVQHNDALCSHRMLLLSYVAKLLHDYILRPFLGVDVGSVVGS